SGSTVSSTVTLSASASDNIAVTRVEFYCDGSVPVGTATLSPYNVPCDTTVMANGSHSFYAKAYDAAGNSTSSAAKTVNVSNTTQAPGPWAKSFGGTFSDSGSASTVDAGGNIVVAGYFKGTANFGGSP